MPTKPNNEVNQEPGKRRNHKQLQKKQNQTADEQKSTVEKNNGRKRKKRPMKRRAFPIWLRIIVVLVLCGAALIVGLMIGYGVIGDGNPKEALNMDTWRHILELIEGGK